VSSKQEEEDAKKKKDGMKRKPYNNITIEEAPQFPELPFFFSLVACGFLVYSHGSS